MQYVLKNERLQATFESAGAELISLKDDAGKEYLWCGNPEFWNRHSPVLFPFVGKVRDGKYRYNGVEYEMGQHGFARDMEFALVSQTEDEIWFALDSTEETKQKYPFDFRLECGYKLMQNVLRVMWKVINPNTEETMHFSIGAHPAFLCPIEDGKPQSEHFMQLDVKEPVYYTANLANGLRLPTQKVLKTEDGRSRLVEGFFYMGEEGTYIFEDYQIKEVALVRPDGRPYVTVNFDMPIVAIWSPEKKQAPFVCIEPWCGRCDAVDFEGNLEDRAWAEKLLPGGIFEKYYDIKIDK